MLGGSFVATRFDPKGGVQPGVEVMHVLRVGLDAGGGGLGSSNLLQGSSHMFFALLLLFGLVLNHCDFVDSELPWSNLAKMFVNPTAV